MATRSKRLSAIDSTGSGLVGLYTVPAGFTTIVKSWTFRNEQASATAYNMLVLTAGGVEPTVYRNPSVAAGLTDVVSAWIVLEAGDVLELQCPTSNNQIYVSGAELVD